MDALRLTYPTQQQGQHLLVETRPDALKHWLEALPYGDMKRTVPQVAQAIASLNRTDLPVDKRAELVELFDHTYELKRADTLLAEGATTIACIDREGQLREIPEFLRNDD